MAAGIPNLKRINVSSVEELSKWLEKNDDLYASFMLVTSTKANPSKHVTHDQVHHLLGRYGWMSPMKYTLNKSLIGHVIQKR